MNKPAYYQERLTVLLLARDVVPRRSKPFPFHLDHIVSAAHSKVVWKAQPAPRASLSPHPYAWTGLALNAVDTHQKVPSKIIPSVACGADHSVDFHFADPTSPRKITHPIKQPSYHLFPSRTYTHSPPGTTNAPLSEYQKQTTTHSSGHASPECQAQQNSDSLPLIASRRRESTACAFRARRREIVNEQPMSSLGGR